ncbi:TRAP transporter large permease [Oscillibacter sp.]|uniref:TRAP transporter large permease n=1 Tax=Oscillibacter sp. TaxID=1945593 RepID=UPI002604CA3B|nr:TRAP transporter large permease [Oscillibacter sp.]MDD3347169.1 TRAP transporter large permease [Oscillibacter sp.]
MSTGTLALLLFGLFVVLMILKVPVSYCLGIASTVCLIVLGYPLTVVSQKIFNALNSFSIMAIPLFILGGNIMSEGGISKRLIEFCESLVGNIRGGLALVVILACAFFAALSGSGPATVVAIGSMMYPEMVKRGYPKYQVAGLVSVAGGLGPIIPPSIIMVVYCTITQTNIASLFSAGFVVGALLVIAMCLISWVMSRKYAWPIAEEKFTIKKVLRSFKHSILALLMPVLVLGGIYSGLFTATEAGAVSVFYSLGVAVFIYKTLKWRDLLKIFKTSAVSCSVILFIMGTSTVFSWLFTVSGISGWIVSTVQEAGLGYYPVLLIITVVLLIFGFFLEGIATVTMLIPLFLPIALAVGIHPLHLGMIVTMTNVMGCMTPPVANNIFACSTFTGLPMGEISKGELPYLGCFFVVLMIVVFCPTLVTMFA